MTTIIAEIASAHMGSPDLCLELIREAYNAGADGVKVQVWSPEEGDFSHMMDKCIPKSGWKKIFSAYRELIGQYYGGWSKSFCCSWMDEIDGYDPINAKHKMWEGYPIVGHQMYPTPIEASLLHKVGPGYGYADHSPVGSPWAFAAPAIAIERGAAMIEKHICLNRDELKKKSKDWCSALEPDEFKAFVKFIREAERSL